MFSSIDFNSFYFTFDWFLQGTGLGGWGGGGGRGGRGSKALYGGYSYKKEEGGVGAAAQRVIGTGGCSEGAGQEVASSDGEMRRSVGKGLGVLRWRAAPSQVDLPLGGLAGRSGGRVVLHRLAQRDLLQPTVFARRVSAPRVGTAVRRHEPHVGHFGTAAAATARPALLHCQGLGAAVGHQLLLPVYLLVRHKGGELGGVLGHLAVGGRLAGHPAGVGVAKLGALVCAVTGHRHVGKRPEVCKEKEEKEKESMSNLDTTAEDKRVRDGDETEGEELQTCCCG